MAFALGFVLAALITLTNLACAAPRVAVRPERRDALPQYPTTMSDTTAHPTPFYLRVVSDNANYNGHNMQYCSPEVTPQVYGASSAYDGGCIDPNLDSPVLAFQLRNGSLFSRKFDDNTGTYIDAGLVGGLKNVTNAWDGTDDQFDAQSFAFKDASDALKPGVFSLRSDAWALQVTGQYQGTGLYQLVNGLWNQQKSPLGTPWVLAWMLCFAGGGDGGEAALAWLQSAKSDPIPVPDGCSIVQLQTEMPALGV